MVPSQVNDSNCIRKNTDANLRKFARKSMALTSHDNKNPDRTALTQQQRVGRLTAKG